MVQFEKQNVGSSEHNFISTVFIYMMDCCSFQHFINKVQEIRFSVGVTYGMDRERSCHLSFDFFPWIKHFAQPSFSEKWAIIWNRDLGCYSIYNCHLYSQLPDCTCYELFHMGSISSWFLFLLVYGYFSHTSSPSAYQVFIEECAASPMYWMSIILVHITATVPYVSLNVLQRYMFAHGPSNHP